MHTLVFLQALHWKNLLLPFSYCPWEETILQALICTDKESSQPHSQESMILFRKPGSNQRLCLRAEKAWRHGAYFNIHERLCLSPMWFQVWRLQWGMFLWSTFKHTRWSVWYQFPAGPTLCTQALCYQLQGFQKLSAFEGCKHSLNIGLGSRKMLMQSWSSLVIKSPSSGKKDISPDRRDSSHMGLNSNS